MSTEQAIFNTVGGYRGDRENRNARLHSAATTNLTLVSALARWLGEVKVYNLSATVYRYLKIYDKATPPTAADTPIWTIPLPPEGSFNDKFAPIPLVNGLAYAITGGAADNDATAINANEVTGRLGWAG